MVWLRVALAVTVFLLKPQNGESKGDCQDVSIQVHGTQVEKRICLCCKSMRYVTEVVMEGTRGG